MDQPRSDSGNAEENSRIPDDMRCKRSDGKQWRCTAMSMPDKTACEKHYYQAKKRATNSQLGAKKRKSLGEADIYLESKSDEFDFPRKGEDTEITCFGQIEASLFSSVFSASRS